MRRPVSLPATCGTPPPTPYAFTHDRRMPRDCDTSGRAPFTNVVTGGAVNRYISEPVTRHNDQRPGNTQAWRYGGAEANTAVGYRAFMPAW